MHSCCLQLFDVLGQTRIIRFVIGEVQATIHVVDIEMLDILSILQQSMWCSELSEKVRSISSVCDTCLLVLVAEMSWEPLLVFQDDLSP